jgi:hypothetical protein
VDAVAAGSPSDAAGAGFFRAIGADDANEGWLFVFGNLIPMNEPESVGAGWHGRIWAKALEHVADFLGVGDFPEMAVAAFTEGGILGNATGVGIHGCAMARPVLRV